MILFLLAIASGILYRMGGSDKYNTKWRDAGIPIVMLIAMVKTWNPWLLLCAVLLGASLTTYWHKKYGNVTQLGWLLSGVGYSLAMLPYSMATGSILPLLIRTILLAGLILGWAVYMNKPIWKWSAAVVQEFGRGFFIIITLGLLCK